jgi:prepilin-type N-terminal cleavage/methylation domain-containing protein
MNAFAFRTRKAFSLIELIAVMVVLAILAGVAAPRFFNYSDQAKTAATEGTLGAVRSGVASFLSNSSFNGSPAYPTYAELTTTGTVMQEPIPANPYTGLSAVHQVTNATQAANRQVSQADQYGWNYYVDNTTDPKVAIFWANCDDETTKKDSSGTAITANDL